MTKYCKSCVYHNKGKVGTRYADWCCRHSTVARKATSICKLQNTRRVTP